MNRSIYERETFHIGSNTKYVCPECKNGSLLALKEKLTTVEYMNYNKLVHEQEDWESDWFKHGFHGVLVCENKSCKEEIVVSGKYTHSYWQGISSDGEYGEGEERICTPEYFERSPIIISINKNTPKEIQDTTIESFSLFWINKESCANKIRVAIEQIMDNFGVAKYPRTGKRIPISLQKRLNTFAIDHPKIAKHLEAIKWIANSGSHSGGVTNSDVLDGYQILEYALNQLYDKEETDIDNLAKKINKKKKPLSN